MLRSLFAAFGLNEGFAVSRNSPDLIHKLRDGWNIFLIGSMSDLSKSSDPKYVFDEPPFLICFFSKR